MWFPRRTASGGASLGVLLLLLLLALLAGSAAGQSVPEVLCRADYDCWGSWTAPLPGCVNGLCRCPAGTCAVYTTSGRDYLYYCGTCGTLGSECNNDMDCDMQWECKSNFCVCDRGEVVWELCVFYSAVPTSVSNLALILLLVIFLIAYKLINSRKVLRMCCCRRSDHDEPEDTRVIGYNPSSGEKTAAYTITHTDFMATSDDPDLEWALELSREAWRRREWLPVARDTWSSRTSSDRPPLPSGLLPHPTSSPTGFPHSSPTGFSPSAEPGTSGWRPRSSSSSSSSTSSVAPRCHHRHCHRRSTLSSISSLRSTTTLPPSSSSSSSSSFCSRTSSLSTSSSSSSHSASPSSCCSCSHSSWTSSHRAQSSVPLCASCCGSADGQAQHLAATRL